MSLDLVLCGDIVLADGVLEGGHVAARGGVIAAIGQGRPPCAAELADHRGRLVLPGLVDGHMHSSSGTGWPGIEGASMSAAAGGVTTCVDMPHDVPRAVPEAAILADKIAEVNRPSHVDMALYGTLRKDGNLHDIPGLVAGGVCAFMLSTYEYDATRFPRPDHPTMLRAFAAIAPTNRMVAIYNEDPEVLRRNELARSRMGCVADIAVVPGATHLFEEPGAREEVARLAAGWFRRWLVREADDARV